jgi:protein farnesyltransferase/geranylgeranyltransferase type-1 subunit alpha
MLNQEYSTRALSLTAHIIDMNPAHYTVWLYRASILKALNLSITEELEWVNEVALSNQKNYQIWHHRQMMIDLLFPTLDGDRAAVIKLAKQETAFMNEMFSLDSKNYHVWSYRQYLVRKLSLFTTQTSSDPEPQVNELSEIERMLKDDVRNNSAWAHRFYIVFSDPGHSTPEARALEQDPLVPASIIDREVEFAQTQTRLAPQNQSPWNYLRGVLRKGGRELASVEEFAREFALFSGDGKNQTEKVTSSHALDLLADVWAEKGEKEKADKALELLGEKYDRIRKKFWEYRRQALKEGVVA